MTASTAHQVGTAIIALAASFGAGFVVGVAASAAIAAIVVSRRR